MPKVYVMKEGEAGVLTKPPDYYKRGKRSRIIRIDKDHPYYRTSNKGSISEPRLIMATHLNRNLTRDEFVYHKDDDCNNNSIDNLVILSPREFATIRDWKRLKNQRDRIISKISVYEQRIIDSGIDPVTLIKDDPEGRWRILGRDREAFERSRRYGSRGESAEYL